jgi:hypothetical protein
MTIKLAGGRQNMKQQGWLSKIVPQPKEATTPCLHGGDPGGILVVAEHILMMRYQCLHFNARRNPRGGSASSIAMKGFQQVFFPGGTKQPAGKEKREGKRTGQCQLVTMKPSSCLDEANHLSTLN